MSEKIIRGACYPASYFHVFVYVHLQVQACINGYCKTLEKNSSVCMVRGMKMNRSSEGGLINSRCSCSELSRKPIIMCPTNAIHAPDPANT